MRVRTTAVVSGLSYDDYQTARVKFYNKERGFGFLTKEDGSDVFFHIRGYRQVEGVDYRGLKLFHVQEPPLPEITQGDQVFFKEETTTRGVSAMEWYFKDDIRDPLKNLQEYEHKLYTELGNLPTVKVCARIDVRHPPVADNKTKKFVSKVETTFQEVTTESNPHVVLLAIKKVREKGMPVHLINADTGEPIKEYVVPNIVIDHFNIG